MEYCRCNLSLHEAKQARLFFTIQKGYNASSQKNNNYFFFPLGFVVETHFSSALVQTITNSDSKIQTCLQETNKQF